MKVKDLIKLMEGKYIIEFKNDLYGSGSTIPDEILNAEVVSIYTKKGEIVINADDTKNTKSLEDLGYSFEAGV